MSKPPELAKRGGAWFCSGSVQLHLGIEENFRPANKAHPALLCADYEQLLARLREAHVDYQENEAIPDQRRAFIDDPFGNRIELLEQ